MLQSFNTTLHVPDVSVPTALKWEAIGASGKLKADEWYDTDREYIESNVEAKDALGLAITEQFYTVVPGFRAQSKLETISPTVIGVMYHGSSAILDHALSS